MVNLAQLVQEGGREKEPGHKAVNQGREKEETRMRTRRTEEQKNRRTEEQKKRRREEEKKKKRRRDGTSEEKREMGGESEGPMTVYDSGLTAQLGESDTAGERERSVGVLIADARVTPERSERLQREREREISRSEEREQGEVITG